MIVFHIRNGLALIRLGTPNFGVWIRRIPGISDSPDVEDFIHSWKNNKVSVILAFFGFKSPNLNILQMMFELFNDYYGLPDYADEV